MVCYICLFCLNFINFYVFFFVQLNRVLWTHFQFIVFLFTLSFDTRLKYIYNFQPINHNKNNDIYEMCIVTANPIFSNIEADMRKYIFY